MCRSNSIYLAALSTPFSPVFPSFARTFLVRSQSPSAPSCLVDVSLGTGPSPVETGSRRANTRSLRETTCDLRWLFAVLSPLCARVSLSKCFARFWDIDHPRVSPFSTTHGDRPENELTYGPRTDSRKFVSRRSLSTHTLKTRIRYQQDHSNVYEAHTFGQAWIVRLQWCAKAVLVRV